MRDEEVRRCGKREAEGGAGAQQRHVPYRTRFTFLPGKCRRLAVQVIFRSGDTKKQSQDNRRKFYTCCLAMSSETSKQQLYTHVYCTRRRAGELLVVRLRTCQVPTGLELAHVRCMALPNTVL